MPAHDDRLPTGTDRGEHGFTLIELLVVVVIIGVLVAIAVPLFLNYRRGAENRSVQSDLRNAALTIEQCTADGGFVYPTGLGVLAGGQYPITCGTAAAAVNVSDGNTLTYAWTNATKSYQLTGTNSGTTTTYTFDSRTSTTSATTAP